ncbi:tRNA (cytosine(34)-2'-O)-methyltransferase TrmL [Idiomarina sp. WRN-38]|jgi:tRNA (cytidine/uridine-2'-O-)-methyltransferase|uniref:tRNA (uridine(34)/cytosine(34)/5- carboxymethylaminomethyluridine(34)-2'-O)- methyltransferase TrmL n=1 Tax=Idiomarina sp. OXR-189 TaxID=3100175 RepID=UPI0007334B7A|nr:tRNA (uridine(34)/cytosine(34)/5-carboxymethylaminomethyluridine(34)-2'-O)-methyltransferase TrmL [Idiomarina sp. OXR-189]KTG24580.1 rRNA methylase [Idiomarina sp. H105]OAE93086.1 tRNA (cytosine(34)-2'-O)-methyltransferase TrmL [Idiomarina sp. WRN-38]WPZ01187.1 tRNA (uridine(34)/cytosine(34)/5-carboxymethylaminomethyluridine(34)-2'-O)-methyltransferase TrmL [Idiomarina sp. OXR-189]|tara:strand:+ start:172 stop:636 length:465 start_codon:yes stop_codon:yes gene_type:complete
MLHLVLFEPEIPPNTGNVIRLAANTGMQLHLIKPLGFELDEKKVRRAGLDYHDLANVNIHENWQAFLSDVEHNRIFACTTKGKTRYTDVQYQTNDVLLFGPETRGLPMSVLETFPSENWLRLPMADTSRSLNLSNSVAIFAYEAWRQLNFEGAR